ncbi:hypothetical protein SAMN04488144_1245 [Methylobacterium sp. 190mf]|uniref:hypothetical protein n=1 Tax=Methylobacterium sp. 190mf TaxID=1761798 RepID=UPI00089F3821|nr:hypothetical protein [Methylobacterium sp. 190mf]SEG56889.1 hypothetical protein SAMN04488144_1245 [Methylobacterium sp. 190mf]
MFDADDTPGYLHDAYRAALDNGLLSLNLTRVGTDNRMWQASSRFAKSSGFHVEIEADALEAVMKALGAWARIGAPAPAGLFDDEPAPEGDLREDMTLADRQAPAEPEGAGLFD